MTYPELNVPLILDLIWWAEQDERWKKNPNLLSLGTWDQGTWSSIEGPDFDREVEDGDFDEDGEAIPMKSFVKNERTCGTAHCQAGAAVVASDYRMVFDGEGDAERCIRSAWTGTLDDKGRKVYADVPGAYTEDISSTARDILGFTDREANAYFNGDNSIDDLKRLANEFAAYRDLPPIFYPEEVNA